VIYNGSQNETHVTWHGNQENDKKAGIMTDFVPDCPGDTKARSCLKFTHKLTVSARSDRPWC
jgi:hypothetical protein